MSFFGLECNLWMGVHSGDSPTVGASRRGENSVMQSTHLLPYEFIERLKALPFVEAIYLYGSRARGTHRRHSDIDLAVVCPQATLKDWQQVVDILDEADTLLEVDYVRLDDEQPDSRLRQNIERDKKVIYERNNP